MPYTHMHFGLLVDVNSKSMNLTLLEMCYAYCNANDFIHLAGCVLLDQGLNFIPAYMHMQISDCA